MTKIIKIESCRVCNNIRKGPDCYYCNTDGSMSIHDDELDSIHPDCPLEDDKGNFGPKPICYRENKMSVACQICRYYNECNSNG